MKTILLAVLSYWGSCQLAAGQIPATTPNKPARSAAAAPTDEFHRLLARSTGTWTGQATMTFSPTAPPLTSTSSLTSTMVMGDLFQLSEVTYIIPCTASG